MGKYHKQDYETKLRLELDEARKQLTNLRGQVAEADAARRHAQEVSSDLVKEKRALQERVADLEYELHRKWESDTFSDETAGGKRAHIPYVPASKRLQLAQADLTRLRELVREFIEAWDHDGEPSAAAYETVVEKARAAMAGTSAPSETVLSVTEWANTTFGQATIRTQIERAKKEFDELLDLLVVSGELPISAGLPIDKKLAEEAADVCICLYRVIGTLDPEAINKKMKKNRARKWLVDANGTAQHIKEGSHA